MRIAIAKAAGRRTHGATHTSHHSDIAAHDLEQIPVEFTYNLRA